MMDYLIVKWIHILSSTLLFGTGIGTAYYLICAIRTRDPLLIASVGKYVIAADWMFTATTMVIQPVTGFYLIYLADIQLASRWVMWSLGLYLLAVGCWLPVVWLQIKLQRLAAAASESKRDLPDIFWRYFWLWFALGIPAFIALVIVFYLMVAKPI
ncbi:MAG: DUF2269 domain-containing protein [Nitrosospira sp.]